MQRIPSPRVSLAIAATSAITVACTIEIGVERAHIGDPHCTDWGCGGNTGAFEGQEVNPLGIDGSSANAFELVPDSLHLPNSPTLTATGDTYVLDIVDGEFVARDAAGAIVAQGCDQMEGAKFVVEEHATAGADTRDWVVKIEDIAKVRLFTNRSDDPEYATAYKLSLHRLDGSKVDQPFVCPEARGWGFKGQANGPELPVDGCSVLAWEEETHYSLLVKGETYDPETAAVVDTGADAEPWFNLACAGTALSKMKLMGLDPELPASHEFATTPEQRQAALRMITARYCGTVSFTHDGHPLVWQNEDSWFDHTAYSPTGVVEGLESYWDADGALCLNVPRYELFTRDKVEEECGVSFDWCPTTCPDSASPVASWASCHYDP